MTTTAIITAQSIGTSTNVGADKFAAKHTFNAATTGFVVEAKITNGASFYDQRQDVEVYFAVTGFNELAANGPSRLKQSAKYLRVTNGPGHSDQRINITPLLPAGGGYLHVWCEVPNMPVAATLDVQVTEL